MVMVEVPTNPSQDAKYGFETGESYTKWTDFDVRPVDNASNTASFRVNMNLRF